MTDAELGVIELEATVGRTFSAREVADLVAEVRRLRALLAKVKAFSDENASYFLLPQGLPNEVSDELEKLFQTRK